MDLLYIYIVPAAVFLTVILAIWCWCAFCRLPLSEHPVTLPIIIDKLNFGLNSELRKDHYRTLCAAFRNKSADYIDAADTWTSLCSRCCDFVVAISTTAAVIGGASGCCAPFLTDTKVSRVAQVFSAAFGMLSPILIALFLPSTAYWGSEQECYARQLDLLKRMLDDHVATVENLMESAPVPSNEVARDPLDVMEEHLKKFEHFFKTLPTSCYKK